MFPINEYFDGKVKSIAFTSTHGPATIGVMAPGEYEFATSSVEIMRVVSGSMEIKLPGREAFETFTAGSEFTVEKECTFAVKTAEETSYLCIYK